MDEKDKDIVETEGLLTEAEDVSKDNDGLTETADAEAEKEIAAAACAADDHRLDAANDDLIEAEPAPTEEEQRALQLKLEEAEQELAALEWELREIGEEHAEFATRKETYQTLSLICESLDELDEAGEAELFWGAGDSARNSGEYLKTARHNLERYSEDVRQLEERQAALIEKNNDKNQQLDRVHYQLVETIELVENQRNEWEVERDADELPARALVMPWARGFEEDQRFRYSLAATLLCSLLLGWLVGEIILPTPERSRVSEVPERVVSLVRKELPPPPPPPAQVPIPEPDIVEPDQPIPEPEPILAEKPPEAIPEVVELPEVAEKAAQVAQEETREQVKTKGILAFRDSFASRANAKTNANLGSQARISNAGETATGRPERNMVSTSAPGSSGGINLADISRDVGGGGQAMDGVAVTRVASTIGGDEGPDRPLSAGSNAGRTDEEIQIVFDRYKAALYRLYNKELRRDPTLRGQLVIRMTIEPDGSVSMCALQSSDMGAPTLAEQVVDRIRSFDFGAKEDIVAMTIIYPIDFLPTA
jgi:outer membrane biosynthesis protein TonB